ncbi:MAG TPA: hypothetical protein VG326_08010 [Tepidisphaeraceae bacterium]|nr:hypothetical protein [Tepidisphaeraceae bacterium]
MKLGLAFIIGVVLNGCNVQPPPERTAVVYGHVLDQLFTDQRGNTVYRFWDQGDFRYYVVGPSGAPQMLPNTTHVTDTTTTTIDTDSGGGGDHDHHGHK